MREREREREERERAPCVASERLPVGAIVVFSGCIEGRGWGSADRFGSPLTALPLPLVGDGHWEVEVRYQWH